MFHIIASCFNSSPANPILEFNLQGTPEGMTGEGGGGPLKNVAFVVGRCMSTQVCNDASN